MGGIPSGFPAEAATLVVGFVGCVGVGEENYPWAARGDRVSLDVLAKLGVDGENYPWGVWTEANESETETCEAGMK